VLVFLNRHKLLNKIWTFAIEHVCKRIGDVVKMRHFRYPEKLQRKLSKCENCTKL